MPSYLWYLEWSDDVSEQLSALPKGERALLFDKIAKLAAAENPYAVAGVEKLIEKRYASQRRIRQGSIRMIFEAEAGDVVHLKHCYKGRLIIRSITNRKDTYR